MDARTRLVLLGCVSVLAITLDRPLSLGLLAGLCAVALLTVRLPAGAWWQGGLLLLGLTWATVLSQGLFYGDHPRVAAVRIGGLVLWREGLLWGLVQSLRLISVTLAGLAVAASTPPERLIVGLRSLGVPWVPAFLATTSLRVVPSIAGSWREVREARALRGRPAWRRAPWRWLALEVALLRPVVARALRKGRTLARTLDARGFDPRVPRPSLHRTRPRVWEYPILAAGCALTVAAVGSRLIWALYVSDVLYVPAWRGLYAFVRVWL
jgi:energy-coupling factor transport system permease protein